MMRVQVTTYSTLTRHEFSQLCYCLWILDLSLASSSWQLLVTCCVNWKINLSSSCCCFFHSPTHAVAFLFALFHIHISFSSTSSATSCNGYTPVSGGGGGESMTDVGFCCCCWNTSIWVIMTASLVFAYCGISVELSSNSGIFDAWYWWCWCWCWWIPFVLIVTIGTSSWPIAQSIFNSLSWLNISDVGVPADECRKIEKLIALFLTNDYVTHQWSKFPRWDYADINLYSFHTVKSSSNRH